MIEKIMKAVKRGNKRRSRNITIGAVIGFLLSCTAVAGADEYLYIKDDSGIQFSTDSTNGADGDWSGSNPYEGVGNVWNENTYVNNIALSGTDNGANDTSGNPEGYGVKLKLSLEEVKFINNGAISAESTSSNAYGIDNVAGSKISLINNGTISASSSGAMATYSNGINNSGIITNLDNSGIVYGVNTDVLTYSNGIYNTGTINKLNNNGILLANKGLMVFGISNDKDGIIDKLNNNGKILSTTGTDYGISNDSLGSFQPKITILSNKGFIGGDSSVIRNGA